MPLFSGPTHHKKAAAVCPGMQRRPSMAAGCAIGGAWLVSTDKRLCASGCGVCWHNQRLRIGMPCMGEVRGLCPLACKRVVCAVPGVASDLLGASGDWVLCGHTAKRARWPLARARRFIVSKARMLSEKLSEKCMHAIDSMHKPHYETYHDGI